MSLPAIMSLLGETIPQELLRRGVVRSANVCCDYAEYLCVQAFGWTLMPKNFTAYDALRTDEARILNKTLWDVPGVADITSELVAAEARS